MYLFIYLSFIIILFISDSRYNNAFDIYTQQKEH